MPPRRRRKGFIAWATSESKQILVEDLEAGLISLDESVHSTEYVWNIYKETPEFKSEKVLFDQFKDRLKDHRKQVQIKDNAHEVEAAALAHDRLITAKPTLNERGEVIFYLTEGHALLKEDVANKMHETLGIAGLYNSKEQYQIIPLVKFKDRVYQAIRREKFINWLEYKRMKKEEKRINRRLGLGLSEQRPHQQP